MRGKYPIFVRLLFVALILFVPACGGGSSGGGGNTTTATTKIYETTEVLDNNTAQSLSSVSVDGNTFTFDGTTDQLQSLSVDDVIIAGESQTTPLGAIRKVTSVYESDGKTIVETEEAGLEDAFEELHIQETITLDSNFIYKNGVLEKTQLKTSVDGLTSLAESRRGSVGVNSNNLTYGISGIFSGSVNVDFDFTPSFDVTISISKGKLEEFKLEVGGNTNFDVNATFNAFLAITSPIVKEKSLLAKPVFLFKKTIWVPVSGVPIPVLITCEFDLLTGITFSTGGKVTTDFGFNTTSDLSAGFSYKPASNPKLTPIKSYDYTFNPNINTDDEGVIFSIVPYIRPKLGFYLYTVAGPFIDIKTYGKGSVVLDSSPHLEAGYGYSVNLGGEIKVKSTSIFSISLELYNQYYTQPSWIWAFNTPPVATISNPPNSSIYNEGDTITFTGSGFDPEDGTLTSSSLVWTSDIDGQIGTGTSFARSDLSFGSHAITLTATDIDNATGTDAVSITINSPSNTAPTASITSPSNGSTYTQGNSISFTGSGSDAEDGTLTGSSLVWTSDIDGQIGTGTSVSTTTLSVGTHTITLTATDSDNATGSASRSITITPLTAGDTWAIKAGMPTARGILTSGVINGKIYVIGGRDTSSYFNTVEEYDPATDTWSTKTAMPTARDNLTSSVVNGRIYAIGGYNPTSGNLNTVEEYDPATDTWSTKTSMPTARHALTSSVVNGKIYVIGGGGDGLGNTVEEYDPTTDTWSTKTSMPTARAYLTSSVVNGKIYVIGGGGLDNTVEEYDPTTDTWSTKTSMPTTRQQLTSSVVNNKIYVIGGSDDGNGRNPLTTVEEYDPATDTWSTKTAMPTARGVLISSVVNGKIFAVGGRTGDFSYLNTVEEYTPPGL